MRRREFIALFGLAPAFWPTRGRAQHGPPYPVGYLAYSGADDSGFTRVFADRLRELGLVEGQNLTLSYRSADGHADKLPERAAELLQANPDVLVAGFGTLTAKTLKAATTTVPIVFANVGDPLGAGLASNLARPGGNVTGFSSLAADISGKRLQLVRELVPSVTSVAIRFNPETPFSALALRELRAAASSAKIQIQPLEAKSAEELPARFAAAAASGPAALIVLDDPLITSLRAELTRLAAAHRLPAIYGDRLFVEAGGLAAYGPDRRVNFRHAAEYVERILKGAKAGDLPVEQSAKFDLALNTTTAKTLGLEITPALLARADEVIE